jgi:methionyl-tRNA synthetase
LGYCSECGKEIIEGDHCSNCGNNIIEPITIKSDVKKGRRIWSIIK